jgi:hypothetical protein
MRQTEAYQQSRGTKKATSLENITKSVGCERSNEKNLEKQRKANKKSQESTKSLRHIIGKKC